MEPFYIRQTSDPMLTREQAQDWAASCAKQAFREGAMFCRFSISEDGKTYLVEAWNAPAHKVDDQGPPRFSFSP